MASAAVATMDCQEVGRVRLMFAFTEGVVSGFWRAWWVCVGFDAVRTREILFFRNDRSARATLKFMI